jgi:hypothetical protein
VDFAGRIARRDLVDWRAGLGAPPQLTIPRLSWQRVTMNFKSTWYLLIIALSMAAFIVAWDKFVAAPARKPLQVVPGFDPKAITRVQVRVTGVPEMLAERTNGGWHMSKPLASKVRPHVIESLLKYLSQLQPDNYLSPREVLEHSSADAEFGFEAPQISLMFYSGEQRRQVLVGAHTAPGDQIFIQLVGTPGIHIVSTNLLNFIPRNSGDWRDTALLDWPGLSFDRLQVTHAGRTTELVQDLTNHSWRLTRLQARADRQLVEESLNQLRKLEIAQFLSDGDKADARQFGLEPPELEMTFSLGTNVQAVLQFGSSVTNATNYVYGRVGRSSDIFAVTSDALAPWRVPAASFRDTRLFSFQTVPDSIAVRAREEFTLTRVTNDTWRVQPGDFIADTNYVNELVLALAQMQVTEFVKDVVTGPDLPSYGLDPALSTYTVNIGGSNAASINVSFGTNAESAVFAKRADETFVATVRKVDFDFLPASTLEMRNRRVWLFNESEVASLRLEDSGQVREMLRKGTNSWSLAEGSFGQINTFGVEETAHRLGDLSAARWVARGEEDRARYGFTTPPRRIIVTLTNGTKHAVEFGGAAPSQYPYALVTIAGQPWVFEFPWATAQYIDSYLSIPGREH